MSATSTCRSCGAGPLDIFLDLGKTPLANSLLTEEMLAEPEPTFGLDMALCPECSLVQITETVPPETLFRNYLYFSSFSDTMLRHAKASAESLMESRNLGPSSLVMEIASNDGYLLKNFVATGVPVLGIEPAENIAKVANENGIRTTPEFFGVELAQSLKDSGETADVILANNVMAHVPDINGVVAGIKILLKPDGVFVMETPYLKELLDNLEFDTVYHEHLFYYSLTALSALFARHGLQVVDVRHLPIHGGSIRVFVAHAGAETPSAAVTELLAEEAAWGVSGRDVYERFAVKVENLKKELVALLTDLKSQGKSIAAYGASAKGSTLLNYMGIGADLLDFVVDRSTVKQGRYTAGTRLPIYPPEKLLEAKSDFVLLLTWNFAEEILAQQAAYRDAGGRFVLPLPEPKVL